jgi:hypothetical protein
LRKKHVKASKSRRTESPRKRAPTVTLRRSKAFLAELRRQCQLANDADAVRELAVLRDADRGDDWANFAVEGTSETVLLRPLKPFPLTRVDEVFGSAARRGRALSFAQMDAAVAAGKTKRGLNLLAKARGEAVRRRKFDRRVQSVRSSVRDVPAAELQATIDEAVREVRKESRRRKR